MLAIIRFVINAIQQVMQDAALRNKLAENAYLHASQNLTHLSKALADTSKSTEYCCALILF